MAQVNISVRPSPSDILSGEALALANISLLDDGVGGFGRVVKADVIVPVSQTRATASVELERGSYVVSLAMPSGDRLVAQLDVSGEDVLDLVLSAEPEPVRLTGFGVAPPVKRVRKAVPKTEDGRESKSVRLRFTDSAVMFDEVAGAIPMTEAKPVSLLSVSRRRRSGESALVRMTKALQPFHGEPRIVELRRQGPRWPSPLLEGDDSFVDPLYWVRQLGRVARRDGVRTETRRPAQGSIQAHLPSLDDPLWFRQHDHFFGRPAPVVGQRYAVTLDAPDDEVSRLAVLPWAWHGVGVRDRDEVVTVDERWDEDAGQWILRSAINDVGIASVLAFLTQGDLSRARRLIRESLRFLMAKVENPYAAAAGGYVLIYSKDEDVADDHWPQWIRNLAAWFPSLPDSQILLATLCFQRRRLVERAGLGGLSDNRARISFARDLLWQAMRGGLPIYALGMRLLVENLEILRDEQRRLGNDVDEYTDPRVEEALTRVRALSRCMTTAQPMTVLDFAGLGVRGRSL